LGAWPRDWASRTFGAEHGNEIGTLIGEHARLAARRKPELIDPNSFAIGEIGEDALIEGEFDEMLDEWNRLSRHPNALMEQIDPAARDAYFQLVAHPVAAMRNLYRLYHAVAWNRRLAAAGDVRANHFADLAEDSFIGDRRFMEIYHRLNGGKWDGMMN